MSNKTYEVQRDVKMNKEVMYLFPALFYFIGLIQSLLVSFFNNWVGWLIGGIGITFYLIAYYWYKKELK